MDEQDFPEIAAKFFTVVTVNQVTEVKAKPGVILDVARNARKRLALIGSRYS
jgi:hypothetical protein